MKFYPEAQDPKGSAISYISLALNQTPVYTVTTKTQSRLVYIHCVHQTQSITLSILNEFSQFFHRWNIWKICDKAVIEDPTTHSAVW